VQTKPIPELCRVAYGKELLIRFLLPVFMASGFVASAAVRPAQDFLVEAGKAKAVIVLGDNSDPFYRFVGEELQRYVKAITGASLEIVTASQASSRPESLLVLIGGPKPNSLVEQAINKKQASFSDLKVDSFLLWRVPVGKKRGLIVGGNDEAATMYAAYDLLERLGITFLLAKDILPEKVADLKLPLANVRAETPFPRRGLLISNIYPNRGIMNLAEVKSMLDQMAKLKMNFLQFFWFEHEPWINFGFRGENKLLGDATGKETGYLTWRYNYGSNLIKDVVVGQNLFGGRERMAPMEFQKVETPEDGFRVAKEFLTEIIRYAKTRKIKVWLCVDPTTLPGNLARFAHRAPNLQLPFHPILGTHMCPADPELHEMNENRLRALVETYPEAEGYFLYVPEMFPDCRDDLNRKFLLGERAKYESVLPPWADYYNNGYERDRTVVLDSTTNSVHIIRKMLDAKQRVAPNAKVGVGGIGRGFLLPLLDKTFPKDVPITDMESRAIWTPRGIPMQLFGGMGERELTIVPRLDDDNGMFGMQFNVNLYYKDRVLSGSVENGVAGFAGQLNRPRGMEQNYRYLSEGAYNPTLTPKEFYEGYARRLFGEAAAPDMVKAFETLEANEEYLGWTQKGNFGCCGVIAEVAMAHNLYKQPNPFDGPKDWNGFIGSSHDLVRYYEQAAENLQQAADAMNAAAPKVAPHGQEELRYLMNKTESYRMHLETLITVRKAYIAFDEAFRMWDAKTIDRAELVRRLDASMALFSEARRMGRETTEKFAEVIDHPSDMGVLYRANLFLVTGLELVEQTMQDIVNYHHGREYTKLVPWNKIYYEFPRFSPPW
jgi:hypothetical protein